MIAKVAVLKYLAIAVLLTAAVCGGGGFWVGQRWADGEAAKRENTTLRAEIAQGRQAIGEFKTAVADGATHMAQASNQLKQFATTYAQGRDHDFAQFTAASNALQRKLDVRSDLAACRFGADILRDINAARAGRPAVSGAGTDDGAAGAGPSADAAVPRLIAAPAGRQRSDDGSAADTGFAAIPGLSQTSPPPQ